MHLLMIENAGRRVPEVQLPSGDVVPVRGVLGEDALATVAGVIAGGPELLDRLAKDARVVRRAAARKGPR